MSLVTFKDLCIDATDATVLGAFWATTLGLQAETLEDGDVVLSDDPAPGDEPDPHRTVWVNTVPEAKTVKQRVHLDVHASSLEDFPASPQLTEPGEFPWTVIADPEGGELCVFVPDAGDGPAALPAYRLKDVVVDCAVPRVVAEFWLGLLGGELGSDTGRDWWWLDHAAGVPFESFDFVPVPEPKTVKNRVHWDVTLDDGVTTGDLVARGAQVLRTPDDDISWTVMADPESNEFCVFPTPS